MPGRRTSSPSTRWPTSARRPSSSARRTASPPRGGQGARRELTRGVGADKAIVTVDIVNEQVVQEAVNAIRKGGTVVITGLADPNKLTVQLSGALLTLFQKEVMGSLFGNSNPQYDIQKMLDLYRTGKIKLDELVTRTYTLDEVNQGYQDLLDGKNLRAVMLHEH